MSYQEDVGRIIFNIIDSKNLKSSLFDKAFVCNLLENTISTGSDIEKYCEDFNRFFETVSLIEIKHTVKSDMKFALLAVITIEDKFNKDLALYAELNEKLKITHFEFYVNEHVSLNIY